MSVNISKIYTRPDESIPWHHDVLIGDDFRVRFHDIYSEHCIEKHRIQIDEYNIKYVTIWTTEEAYQAFLADPIFKEYWATRDEYNQIMGIIAHDSVIERTT
jgi:hypothetical protein